MKHPPHSPDCWDDIAPTGTPGERFVLMLAVIGLALAVLYLLMDPYLTTSAGDDVDHPAVLVPATAGPAVDFEGN